MITAPANASAEQELLLRALVDHYRSHSEFYATFLDQIHSLMDNSSELRKHVHSVKFRLKDPDHLADKLRRKMVEKGDQFDYTVENLFVRVTDLAGYRILHLHVKQMAEIHQIIMALLDHAQFRLHEPPSARIWDEESRAYFEGL